MLWNTPVMVYKASNASESRNFFCLKIRTNHPSLHLNYLLFKEQRWCMKYPRSPYKKHWQFWAGTVKCICHYCKSMNFESQQTNLERNTFWNFLNSKRLYNFAFAMVSSECHLDESISGSLYNKLFDPRLILPSDWAVNTL